MEKITAKLSRKKTEEKAKSVLDTEDKTEKLVVESCFTDLTNFPNLRDPLDWAGTGSSSSPAEVRADMMRFQPEKMSRSLTKLTPIQETTAVKCFKDVLRCMGDQPGTFSADKQEPVLQVARKSTALCDEVYLQVLKQLNNNPTLKSAQSGWELLQGLCGEMLPSDALEDFLRAFLVKASAAVLESGETTGGNRRKSVVEQAEERSKNRKTLRLTFYQTVQPKLATQTLDIYTETLSKKNTG